MRKYLLLSVLMIAIANLVYSSELISFSESFKCDELSNDICIVGDFEPNINVNLLEENSFVCQAITQKNYIYDDGYVKFSATRLKIVSNCDKMKLLPFLVISKPTLNFRINKTTKESINLNFSEQHMIKLIFNSNKNKIAKKATIYNLDKTSSLIRATVNYYVAGKIDTSKTPLVYRKENKWIQLVGPCASDPLFFSIGSSSYFSYKYTGCDTGELGMAIYKLSDDAVELIYNGTVWSN